MQNPPVGHPDSHIQPCKLSHKKVGQLIVKAFGNFICAFCPIPLSRPAVLTAVPSLILLPHTLSIHLSRHSLHIQDLNEEQGYGGNVTIPVSVNNCSLILFFLSWTTKENFKTRKMDISQEMGWGKMFMDVGKSTVQLSHVINYIIVYKPGQDTLLQTKDDTRLVSYVPYKPEFLFLH